MTTQGRTAAGSAAGPALDVVADLHARLADLEFPLEVPGVVRARALRRRVESQLATHLLPRLRDASLPLIAVVGGPTGAGKSTLVNALAGAPVSDAGVVRPTTRRPVLVTHPDDAPLLAGHPVSARSEPATADLPRGLALLDAPDVDSVDQANRELAVELVEVADIWLFVTTATRYGDALPWQVLADVRRRGITAGVVLDRVEASALDAVRRDLLARLEEAGFGTMPLFTVPDVGPGATATEGSPVTPEHVAEIAAWLRLVASPAGSREIVSRTIRGVWSPLRAEVRELLEAVMAQVDAASELTAAASAQANEPAAALASALRSGALATGSATARWLTGASARGPLEPLAHEVTGLFARRRVAASATARERALTEVLAEAEAAFRDLMLGASADVVDRVLAAWSALPGGAQVIEAKRRADEAAGAGGDELRGRAAAIERAWGSWLAGLEVRAPESGLVTADGARRLAALAAVGVDGAVGAARRLGFEVGATALDGLIAEAERLLGDRASACAALVPAELSPDAAAALRVRVGELRLLAGEG